MDNMAYLQQIATPPKKEKTSIGSLMNGPLFKVLIGVGILAIIIIIVGIATSGHKTTERPLVEQIQLRSANLIKTIGTYNKKLKSSTLRSYGQSLSAVLNETDHELTTLMKSDYPATEDEDNADSKSLKTSEQNYINKVNETLETARLNAVLDRTYANQMALEISLLSSLESSLIAETSNDTLKSYLSTSINNLSALHNSFDNFSDSNI